MYAWIFLNEETLFFFQRPRYPKGTQISPRYNTFYYNNLLLHSLLLAQKQTYFTWLIYFKSHERQERQDTTTNFV